VCGWVVGSGLVVGFVACVGVRVGGRVGFGGGPSAGLERGLLHQHSSFRFEADQGVPTPRRREVPTIHTILMVGLLMGKMMGRSQWSPTSSNTSLVKRRPAPVVVGLSRVRIELSGIGL